MSIPYKRADLDSLTCDNPDCEHDHEGLVFHGRCHPHAPTWALYERGVITLTCSECEGVVVRVEVAS